MTAATSLAKDRRNIKMKITKKQLRRIIKEEKRKILKESWGEKIDTGSDVITFAQAYSGLGDAVQGQVDAIVAAYFNGGGPRSEEFKIVVGEQNPDAIDLAIEKLPQWSDVEAIEEIIDALEAAQKVYRPGDAEVEADADTAY